MIVMGLDGIVVLPDDRENVKLLVAKCSFSSVYTSYTWDFILVIT